MNILIKLVFVILAIFGVVAVFYVSWFWRALIIPMVVILLADVVMSLFKREKRN